MKPENKCKPVFWVVANHAGYLTKIIQMKNALAVGVLYILQACMLCK
jgi:hypothetical protein